MILRIDNRDRVASVSPDWHALARDTGVDPLLPGAEPGRPYRGFIRNDQIAQILKTLLERTRMRRDVVRIPLRADSARERRFFQMEIEAVEGGAVELRLTAVRSELRPAADWRTPSTTDEMIRVCSFCHRAQWDLEWMELDEAIARGDLFGEFTHWRLSHGSCPDCLQERMREIQGR